MAGLEELKKKLVPLFDAEKGFPSGSTIDPSDSYMVKLLFNFMIFVRLLLLIHISHSRFGIVFTDL